MKAQHLRVSWELGLAEHLQWITKLPVHQRGKSSNRRLLCSSLKIHCQWICPVLCISNTSFTWTNTSSHISPLLPCAAFFFANLQGFSFFATYLRAPTDKALTLHFSRTPAVRPCKKWKSLKRFKGEIYF